MKKNNSSVLLFLSILFLSLFLFSCVSTKNPLNPVISETPQKTQIVTTKCGQVRGIFSDDSLVEIFAGIPYAQPPIGDLRWREPKDVLPWDGVLEADTFASRAMQVDATKEYTALLSAYTNSPVSKTYGAPMSEDCLYLNIWRPADYEQQIKNNGGKLPVLVYIHGGSLVSGASWDSSWDGKNMAQHGIIVVTIAYRLNVFGYMAHEQLAAESPNHTTGNYGLLDQVKALEWVNANIGEFGGDKNNITIAGESAGSTSVCSLCATPLAKGLFKRAIGESSSVAGKNPPHTYRTFEVAKEIGENIMKEFNATSIEEMRKIPAEELVLTKYKNDGITVDGYAMPEPPYEIFKKGQNNEEALLNGYNEKEAFAFTFFIKLTSDNFEKMVIENFGEKGKNFLKDYPYKTGQDPKRRFDDLITAGFFGFPHYEWSNFVKNENRPVYEYYFSKHNPCITSYHSGEIIYAYRNVPDDWHYTKDDYELSETISSYWLNFIKTGNPNGEDTKGNKLPEWIPYSKNNQLMLLDTQLKMIDDPCLYIYDYLKD